MPLVDITALTGDTGGDTIRLEVIKGVDKMEHLHSWEVVESVDGFVAIECEDCKLKVEFYPKHLSVWRYGDDKRLKATLNLDYPADYACPQCGRGVPTV